MNDEIHIPLTRLNCMNKWNLFEMIPLYGRQSLYLSKSLIIKVKESLLYCLVVFLSDDFFLNDLSFNYFLELRGIMLAYASKALALI